jgi:DNA-binding GntR family transcriptional regulator
VSAQGLPQNQRIDKASTVAADKIAGQLRSDILGGRLAPGERIMQEVLAEQFGASRMPVREALRILQSDGLVTLISNSGAWVSKLSMAECAEAYEIRERLEPLLIRESIPLLSDHEIDVLTGLVEALEENTDVEMFLRLDRQFHLLSYSAAPTAIVSEIIHRLWNTTQHYRRAFTLLMNSERRQITTYEHRLLIDAIQRRDTDEAERTLLGHIRRTRHELGRHPELFIAS